MVCAASLKSACVTEWLQRPTWILSQPKKSPSFYFPWNIKMSKFVEQKSGSKQNCPNGHIHSNRQTLFQLLTHSQRKAVQIFSASQNGIWETLLWTITRTSEWDQHINGPLLDDYTKKINIYVSGERRNGQNRKQGCLNQSPFSLCTQLWLFKTATTNWKSLPPHIAPLLFNHCHV